MRADTALRRMAELPYAELDRIAPGTALILAPHADDESLGCGGLISEACARGRPPLVVVVTDGVGSHPNSPSFPPDRLRAVREGEAVEAVAALGLAPDRVEFLRLPDRYAPESGPDFDRAVDRLATLIEQHAADTLCVTWPHDPHCDHLASYRIAAAVARRTGVRLRLYPVWGWLLPPETELPDIELNGARLAIGPHLDRKRRAIAAHASQYGDLIADDPAGFRLPTALLAVFQRPFEVFLEEGAA